MQVGVNYPWRDYGWDFGLAPPAWRAPGAEPRWAAEIDADLRHFRALGLTVVRWFILADGLAYGHGPDAPREDSTARTWRFNPPPLDDEVREHFRFLLERFAAARDAGEPPIQLLPVFIDFHFCGRGRLPVGTPDWVKQGRADALTDAGKRTVFLDRALAPLLEVAAEYSNLVFAFELINEPEWITNDWHPQGRWDLPVDTDTMAAFIREGTERIRAAGLPTTVGFATGETPRRFPVEIDVDQFHHYPGGRQALPGPAPRDRRPVVLGEFATAANDVWPELARDGQGVFDRLKHAEAQGYSLALPWAFRSRDRRTAWSPEVERDLRAFATRRA